jgi:hypothetical protein
VAGDTRGVNRHANGGDYVVLDFDLAVKYHPRFRDVWNIPDAITGKPTGVGVTIGLLACNHSLEGILIKLYQDLVTADKKYNIILQSHEQLDMPFASDNGYVTTLLYVGVPLSVAVARTRKRAVETGKFLAETLQEQDEIVENMWNRYALSAPWYGLWADQFLVANNRKEARSDARARAEILKNVREIPLHGKDWHARMTEAREAISTTT